MHPYLLNIPNTLFYDGEIESGYEVGFEDRFFLDKDKPLFFVNVNG